MAIRINYRPNASGTNVMARLQLLFEDLETGDQWTHYNDDWILTYCNFNSTIHPCLLRHGQYILVKDVNGHMVRITARRIAEAI